MLRTVCTTRKLYHNRIPFRRLFSQRLRISTLTVYFSSAKRSYRTGNHSKPTQWVINIRNIISSIFVLCPSHQQSLRNLSEYTIDSDGALLLDNDIEASLTLQSNRFTLKTFEVLGNWEDSCFSCTISGTIFQDIANIEKHSFTEDYWTNEAFGERAEWSADLKIKDSIPEFNLKNQVGFTEISIPKEYSSLSFKKEDDQLICKWIRLSPWDIAFMRERTNPSQIVIYFKEIK